MSQTSAPLSLAQWVATHLEFTPYDTDFVWSKSLLERIRNEVPHVSRNKISAFLKQQGARSDTKHCKATGKSATCIFKVRYRTASLEPLSAQSAPEEGVDAAPTFSQWFSANIEVIDNEDDVFPRSAVVVAAMAQVANVDEQAITRFFKRLVLGCANSGQPTLLLLLLLLLLLSLLLLMLLLLTPVLVCLLLLLPLLLTPILVCGSVASGMHCLLNIPKMLMVN